jgi:hypothetical protein
MSGDLVMTPLAFATPFAVPEKLADESARPSQEELVGG